MLFSADFASTAAQLLILVTAANASPLSKAWQKVDNATIKGLNQEDGHFTIHQVINPSFNTSASGPVAHANAILKYGGELTSSLSGHIQSLAVAGSSTGSVTASPLSYDSQYMIPVSIGTPAQTINLNLDTGSSDLWVFSNDTPKAQVKGQSIYNATKSSTSKKVAGAAWSIKYGDGSSVSGSVYQDKVTIGGITATSQAVESAQTVSASFTNNAQSSGLLGLAYSVLNTVTPTKQKTWFDNVKSTLASPVFTANLKKGKAGSYTFGKIDKTQYTGSIGYAPLTSQTYWRFTGSGFKIGNDSFNTTNIDAVADTGTTLLLLPSKIVTAYYAKVKGATYSSTYGAYVFPCSSTLPSFTFGVGSYRGVVPGTYMNYAQYSSTMCYGGLQANAGLPFSILGDIFLKAQFVVFDAGNSRVGFANKNL